jgi:hypothetical protein
VISTGAEGVIAGTVGADRPVEEGYAAARACALTLFAVLRQQIPARCFLVATPTRLSGMERFASNGIECPADVTLRFHVHKQRALAGPMIESAAPSGEAGDAWMVVESRPDAIAAARAATSRMIDLLMERWGFRDVDGYLLCSVAMHLRLSQVVNEPMFTVSAGIAKPVCPRGSPSDARRDHGDQRSGSGGRVASFVSALGGGVGGERWGDFGADVLGIAADHALWSH